MKGIISIILISCGSIFSALSQDESLVIGGAMVLSNVADTANVVAGTVRWNGWDFEGYDGDQWYSLTGKDSLRHYVGEFWGGGIVFHTYDKGRHGLIASLRDIDDETGVVWAPAGEYKVTNAQDFYNGYENTRTIVDSLGIGDYAAYRCDTFSGGGFTDWYLPSIRELRLLINNEIIINDEILQSGIPNAMILSLDYKSVRFGNLIQSENPYWSSTENPFDPDRAAMTYDFLPGVYLQTYGYKDEENLKVRAIRKF